MRAALISMVLSLILVTVCGKPALAFSDSELRAGFYETVFGAEFASWGWQSNHVKKYTRPVRVYIDNRATIDRRAAVSAFVRSLPRTIKGLDISVVNNPKQANFTVYVVDRNQYKSVVRNDVYKNRKMRVPGRCLVRVLSRRSGIRRSDAVIVSDEGEFVFNRCLIEEVLQGLGPVNDSPLLQFSVFNDTSDLEAFTAYDQHLLNILYDPRIKPGMNKKQVDRIFDKVLHDVRSRL